MLTFDIFMAFWQKLSPQLHFPGTIAGDDATCTEWEENKYGVTTKYFGMRKADGAKHGVIREVNSYSYGDIWEQTYFEDKKHGLSFLWYNGNSPAFQAMICDQGKPKAFIEWNSDWSERYSSGNKELILGSDGLSLFKK